MDEITISMDLVLGLAIGVAIPLLIWGLRIYSMVKQTRDMHLEPDEHGFGSEGMEKALQQHTKADIEFQREILDSNKALRYAFKELSHFMRWMVKERTGKEPPPYVRE